jgi:hypothetical protein
MFALKVLIEDMDTGEVVRGPEQFDEYDFLEDAEQGIELLTASDDEEE